MSDSDDRLRMMPGGEWDSMAMAIADVGWTESDPIVLSIEKRRRGGEAIVLAENGRKGLERGSKVAR